MSPKVDRRELAKQQRRHLKKHGWTDQQIQAFAQLMAPAAADTTDLPACEQAT